MIKINFNYDKIFLPFPLVYICSLVIWTISNSILIFWINFQFTLRLKSKLLKINSFLNIFKYSKSFGELKNAQCSMKLTILRKLHIFKRMLIFIKIFPSVKNFNFYRPVHSSIKLKKANQKILVKRNEALQYKNLWRDKAFERPCNNAIGFISRSRHKKEERENVLGGKETLLIFEWPDSKVFLPFFSPSRSTYSNNRVPSPSLFPAKGLDAEVDRTDKMRALRYTPARFFCAFALVGSRAVPECLDFFLYSQTSSAT